MAADPNQKPENYDKLQRAASGGAADASSAGTDQPSNANSADPRYQGVGGGYASQGGPPKDYAKVDGSQASAAPTSDESDPADKRYSDLHGVPKDEPAAADDANDANAGGDLTVQTEQEPDYDPFLYAGGEDSDGYSPL